MHPVFHTRNPALRWPITAVLLAMAILLSACSEEPAPDAGSTVSAGSGDLAAAAGTVSEPETVVDASPAVGGQTPDGPREIEWDHLIPDDYRPDLLFAEYDIENISDDDPRADELMEKLRELWDKAPVRGELDGEAVRLPGFVVPVEADENETTGFLLVPYYGACIHVPPPPANQTVYVIAEAGRGTAPELFDVVWVSGTMSVNRISTDLAEAGYTLYASKIEPYEEPL
jgi:hypothetical protein